MMEWEAKPLGVHFDGVGLRDDQWWPGFPGMDFYGTVIPVATVYHWRARLLYNPATTPFQPASRWVTMPWNGWNEADLRTPGMRIMLPIVLRNH